MPEPFPIFLAGDRYLIYDVDTVSHARREHHLCGVLSGTIPQISQQNLFLGIPLELMPEEARLLVEDGHAYIVDDANAHGAMLRLSEGERAAFHKILDKQGREASQSTQQQAHKRKEDWLRKSTLKRAAEVSSEIPDTNGDTPVAGVVDDDTSSLFSSTPSVSSKSITTLSTADKFYITPTTSHPPLPSKAPSSTLPLPKVSSAYPLFAYLHSKGFFMSPGLRFGCHYCVYPGDPLRFHSHFLAVGKNWTEEFQMLDIVGGGRLGTAVKKAYLLGGEDPSRKDEVKPHRGVVRAFSIEWAGM